MHQNGDKSIYCAIIKCLYTEVHVVLKLTHMKITYAHQKLAQLGSTQIMAGKMRERVSLSAVIKAIAARMFLAIMERVTAMMILNV